MARQRRSTDPEKVKSVRKRAAARKNRRVQEFFGIGKIDKKTFSSLLEDLAAAETPSDRYPQGQVEYVRDEARRGTPRAVKGRSQQRVQRKKGGAVRKYSKGGAVNLNRTIRGPNS